MTLLKKKFFSLLGFASVLLFLIAAGTPVYAAWPDITLIHNPDSLANRGDGGYSNQTLNTDGSQGLGSIFTNGLNVFYNDLNTQTITGSLNFETNNLEHQIYSQNVCLLDLLLRPQQMELLLRIL